MGKLLAKSVLTASAVFFLFAAPSFSQVGGLEGKVTGEDGKPLDDGFVVATALALPTRLTIHPPNQGMKPPGDLSRELCHSRREIASTHMDQLVGQHQFKLLGRSPLDHGPRQDDRRPQQPGHEVGLP